MVLCWMVANHPTELRSDFQRFYGLNLDGMGTDYTVEHASCLAATLPSDSAVMRAVNPRNGWTITEYLLHAIEFDLRVLAWMNSKDGAKGKNRPKPLPTPEDEARVRGKIEATDLKMIADALGIKGVDGDGRPRNRVS